eukprot:scaffold62468_cov45-Attheya_sp.AAC.2
MENNKKHVWPFKDCHHEGWKEGEDGMMFFSLPGDKGSDCCQNPTEIHKKWEKGRELFCAGEWAAALPFFRETIKMTPRTPEDYMLKSRAYVHLGCIVGVTYQPKEKATSDELNHHLTLDNQDSRYERQNVDLYTVGFFSEKPPKIIVPPRNIGLIRNDWESVKSFKKCTEEYGHPGAQYLYGTALLYGTGGLKRDIPKGIELLHQAASEKIGEAYFELGSVYERGIGDGRYKIDKDISAARSYYMSTLQLYGRKDADHWWIPEIAVVQRLLPTEIWHASEDTVNALIGERFVWSVVGQAFLFGAAATYGSTGQPDHFSLMLIILPCLGMLLSLISAIVTREAIIRIQWYRKEIDDMNSVKFKAYHAIVCVVEEERGEHIYAAAVNEEKARNKKTFLICQKRRKMNILAEYLALLMPWAFFFTWAALVVQEAYSLKENCSNWFESTCVNNRVFCKNDMSMEC